MASVMLLAIMGICTALNFVVIISKYRRGRYADATLDFLLLGVICFLFSAGINELAIGMIASACISTYLWFNPISLANMFSSDNEEE